MTTQPYRQECWLSPADISSVEYSAYWNDEKQEEGKEGNILNGDFSRMEQFLDQVGVARQLEQCVEFLSQNLNRNLQGVGADLASGNLWAVPRLLSAGQVERIYCVEYSEHRLLRIGPRLLQHYRVPAEKAVLCLGSFYDLNLPDQSLDFVLLSEAFHHAERPGELLSEISRVLCSAGVVMIIGEYEFTRTDVIKHFGKYLISRFVPESWQKRILRRTITAATPFPTGQILVDPILGDHWYSEESYRQMFSGAGFKSYRIKTKGCELQAFVLVKEQNGNGEPGEVLSEPLAATSVQSHREKSAAEDGS